MLNELVIKTALAPYLKAKAPKLLSNGKKMEELRIIRRLIMTGGRVKLVQNTTSILAKSGGTLSGVERELESFGITFSDTDLRALVSVANEEFGIEL